MINIRSASEVDKMTRSCQIVKETMDMIEEWVQPGITTLELDSKAEEFIRSKMQSNVTLEPFYFQAAPTLVKSRYVADD